MGYESRLYVVDKITISSFKNEFPGYICVDKIAKFDLGKMAIGFTDIFTTDAEFSLYEEDLDCTTDKYGERIKYTDIQSVINWMGTAEKVEHYRRIPPVLSFLKSLQEESTAWENLIVIHYGY